MSGRGRILVSAPGGNSGPDRLAGDHLGGASRGETLRRLRTPREWPAGADLRLPGIGRAVQPGVARLSAPHRPNRVGWIRPLGNVRPGVGRGHCEAVVHQRPGPAKRPRNPPRGERPDDHVRPLEGRAGNRRTGRSASRAASVRRSPETGAPNRDAAGVRYFGPGVHHPGKIQLKSGETLYVAGGAVVYTAVEARGAVGVRIRGRGIIDTSQYARIRAADASGSRIAPTQRSKALSSATRMSGA